MKNLVYISLCLSLLGLFSCNQNQEGTIVKTALKSNAFVFEQEISKVVDLLRNKVSERGNRPREVEVVNLSSKVGASYRQFANGLLEDTLQLGESRLNWQIILGNLNEGEALLVEIGNFSTSDTATINNAFSAFEQDPKGEARYALLNVVAKEVLDHINRLSVLVGGNGGYFFLPRFSYTSQVACSENGCKHQVSLNPMDPFVIQECEVSYDKVEVLGDSVDVKYSRLGNALLLEFEAKGSDPYELKCEGVISKNSGIESGLKQGFSFQFRVGSNSSNYR